MELSILKGKKPFIVHQNLSFLLWRSRVEDESMRRCHVYSRSYHSGVSGVWLLSTLSSLSFCQSQSPIASLVSLSVRVFCNKLYKHKIKNCQKTSIWSYMSAPLATLEGDDRND